MTNFSRPLRFAALIACVIGASVGAAKCRGETSIEPPNPQEQIRQVARLQLAGEIAQADELLLDVLAENPDLPQARWQAGYVQSGDSWLRPWEVVATTRDDQALAEYRQIRDALMATEFPKQYVSTSGPQNRLDAMTSVGRRISDEAAPSPAAAFAHWRVADWCREHHLPNQERAHVFQAVKNDSSYLERAAARLGLVVFRGELVTRAQHDEEQAKQVQAQADLQRWTDKLLALRKASRNHQAALRDSALAEMAAIDDPAAISAAESFTLPGENSPKVSGAAKAFERAIIELLGRIDHPDATDSLVRHAVLAQTAEIRAAAAKKLQTRSIQDVVPTLLGGFGWPAQFRHRAQMSPGTDWRQNAQDSEQWNALLRVTALARSNGLPTRPRLAADANRQFQWPSSVYLASLIVEGPTHIVEQNVVCRAAGVTGAHEEVVSYQRMSNNLESVVVRYNESLPQRNSNVSAAIEQMLETRSESELRADAPVGSADPDDWCRWWNNYCDLGWPERKTYVNVDYAINTVGQSPESFGFGGTGGGRVGGTECFPKGTLVSTALGAQPIEAVKIGDSVLTRDCRSGELAYKPVLATTVRPATKILAIDAGGRAIRTSQGHPFFVSGKGWRMAKQLQPGDRLCCLGCQVTVSEVKPEANKEPVYNLVVADSQTYFVGDQRLLVHDISDMLPTAVVLPGYAASAK